MHGSSRPCWVWFLVASVATCCAAEAGPAGILAGAGGRPWISSLYLRPGEHKHRQYDSTPHRALLQQVPPAGLATCAALAQQGPFNSIWDAILKLNLTDTQHLLEAAGMTDLLNISSIHATMFAPNADAWTALRTTDFPTANFPVARTAPWPETAAALAVALYHWIPGSLPSSISNAASGQQQEIPTQMVIDNSTSTLPAAFINPNLTLWTVGGGGTYAGGMAPGTTFNISCGIAAGNSTLYVINNVLVPPSLSLVQRNGTTALSVYDVMASMPQVSDAFSLVQGDALGTALLSDPNLLATVFVPTNEALRPFLARASTTLEQFNGTRELERLMLSHIIPGPPYLIRTIPDGKTAGIATRSTNKSDTLTFVKTKQGSTFTVSVMGPGNSSPIPLDVPRTSNPFAANPSSDILAGKCTVFVIHDVILPEARFAVEVAEATSASLRSAASLCRVPTVAVGLLWLITAMLLL